MTWSESDYNTLAAIVFRPDYPGNATARGVAEDPAGLAGAGMDTGKRYAHVAWKYLKQYSRDVPGASGRRAILEHYLHKATAEATLVAYQTYAPPNMWPSMEFGALRVLEYPAGAASALHTDFDLFTINLWRSCPNPGLPSTPVHMGELGELLGLGPATPHEVRALSVVQRSLVYFAMPSHDAILPSGQSVGQWVAERKARSRIAIKGDK